ncbi:dihydrofolate reductase family protein [Pseudochryseolinea flava]|uniref:Dihydrofolate reductase n=1 Tax=Pseudochryseolinea flava TaxID=2059302 RepID=A0A364Y2P7_9BACT|nr:dihydrofolate reductase family protein [Pseudochryseolinea flava]RAW00582.1 dihydrofolate reductase [Pseudochryseolinea flava]
MAKIVATLNIALNGSCDHTSGIADEGLHDHYTDVIRNSDIILYGRTTYQLMEGYWPGLVKNPSGEKSMDDFANALHHIQKVVFSRTLKSLSWENSVLATKSLEDEVQLLKKQPGKDVLIGSPSLINALAKLDLIDEYHLCIHPVIAQDGLLLFHNIPERRVLKLKNTKIFKAGQVMHYYERIKD